MAIEIREEVIKYTTECINSFACLSDAGEHLCKIRYPRDKTFFMVHPKSGRDCKYCTTFGVSSLCLCPTRREIYRRYQI